MGDIRFGLVDKPTVSVVDFDDTLHRHNYGVIERTAEYLIGKRIYILTYRYMSSAQFIIDTVNGAGLNLVGVACAESRSKDPATKLALLQEIQKQWKVEEIIDDDHNVLSLLSGLGIPCRHPNSL